MARTDVTQILPWNKWRLVIDDANGDEPCARRDRDD
jgi:hypothetical protein